MPISTVLNTKTRLTMLCLSGFELYPRWMPLFIISNSSESGYPLNKNQKLYY